MNSVTLSGPSADAEWGVLDTGVDVNRPRQVRFIPDLNNEKLESSGRLAVGYVLPDQPLAAMDASGGPIMSLTLVLSGTPDPEEDSIHHLIQQGIVSFETTLALPHSLLESLRCKHHVEYRPLFARDAAFRLLTNEGIEIASTSTSGTDGHASLNANLNRDQATSFLSAINGQSSTLQLEARLTYAASSQQREMRIQGKWADIYDFLFALYDKESEFDAATFKQHLSAMLAQGILTATDPVSGHANGGISAELIFQSLVRMASIILQRQTPELPSSDERNRYILRERPHPMFMLDYSESIPGGNCEKQVLLTTNLSDVLGGVLEGLAQDKFIHLVIPDANGNVSSAPRRIKSRSQRRSMTQKSTAATRMIALNNDIQSISLAVAPEKKTVPMIMSNASMRPAIAEVFDNRHSWTWLVDDLVFDQYKPPKTINLPLVENPRDGVWRDRYNKSLYWYIPTFSIANVVPNVLAADSAFLFDYEVIGTTASGDPALKGIVRIELQMTQSEEVKRALRRVGNPTAKSVNIENLSVAMEIPFIDEHGHLRTHRLPADIERQGNTVVAIVEMLNDWVRLTYGGLAITDFQQQKVKLQIGYSFPAYTLLKKSDVQLVFGGKTAITPILYSNAEVEKTRAPIFVNAATSAVHVPAGILNLKRETAVSRTATARAASGAGHAVSFSSTSAMTHVASKPQALNHIMVAAKPQLVTAVAIVPEKKKKYARRSIARQESLEAFFPCEQLGAYYRKTGGETIEIVGCRHDLKLASTTYKLYDEIIELRHDRYRVFRSLQQPGRFLVLPAEYSISRHEHGRETAYRPCAIFYSIIDASTPANNRVVFEASLQPDIPLHVRASLLETLMGYSLNPILEYPTQIMVDAEYAWTISSTLSEPTVIEWGDALRVALDVNFTGGLLLQNMLVTAGVPGSVDFKLADGATLRSRLNLDLSQISGPWKSGPLEITRSASMVQITNRTQQSLMVSSIDRYVNQSRTESINIDTTFSAGQSHVLEIEGNVGELYPVYRQQGSMTTSLEESRVFVEDVTTNVVFFVQLNYSNHDIETLDINARLKDVEGIYAVPLSGEPPVGTVNLTLPLTDYLRTQTLQFQVTKIFSSGEHIDTSWIDWDLETSGNIISLTWELISV